MVKVSSLGSSFEALSFSDRNCFHFDSQSDVQVAYSLIDKLKRIFSLRNPKSTYILDSLKRKKLSWREGRTTAGSYCKKYKVCDSFLEEMGICATSRMQDIELEKSVLIEIEIGLAENNHMFFGLPGFDPVGTQQIISFVLKKMEKLNDGQLVFVTYPGVASPCLGLGRCVAFTMETP